MRDSDVLEFQDEPDLVHGKVMFVIKDSFNFVVFDVAVPRTEEDLNASKLRAHEHMLILSDFYLESILEREAGVLLGERSHYLAAVCPEHAWYTDGCPECENPPEPFQNFRNGYRVGTTLVNTRDASWGSIKKVKYIIGHRDDRDRMATRYVIGPGCEVLDQDDQPLVLDENLTDDSFFDRIYSIEYIYSRI